MCILIFLYNFATGFLLRDVRLNIFSRKTAFWDCLCRIGYRKFFFFDFCLHIFLFFFASIFLCHEGAFYIFYCVFWGKSNRGMTLWWRIFFFYLLRFLRSCLNLFVGGIGRGFRGIGVFPKTGCASAMQTRTSSVCIAFRCVFQRRIAELSDMKKASKARNSSRWASKILKPVSENTFFSGL